MEGKQPVREDVSSVTAVFLGALAHGVNGPTWNALKGAFLMLGVCLCVILGLAFSSSDFTLVLHVCFLVFITGTLFFLISRKRVMASTQFLMHIACCCTAQVGVLRVLSEQNSRFLQRCKF